MTTDLLKLEAQAAIDDLRQKDKLPFELEARILTLEGSEVTIYFHDSRLRSITVTWEPGQSFKEIVRAALMDRVSGLSGP